MRPAFIPVYLTSRACHPTQTISILKLIFLFFRTFADVSPYGFDLKIGGYDTPRTGLSQIGPKMLEADLRCVLPFLLAFLDSSSHAFP